MVVAYIAHPVSGNVKSNLNKIKAIVRKINLKEPNVVPFASYYVDCQAMDDSIPTERSRGIKNNHALLNKGFIDEMRLYGNRIGAGMIEEIELAHELGIPVIPMTKQTKTEYINLTTLKNEEA
jgi:hypothetical protein